MMDSELLRILACPHCKEKLTYLPEENTLHCKVDKSVFRVENNIPIFCEKDSSSLTSKG